MRKCFLKFLQVSNGFLLLSAFYCCIMQLVQENEKQIFFRSLLLLPLAAILSVSVNKVKHFWQYLMIAVVSGCVVIASAGNGFSKIWMAVCVILAAVSHFAARAGRRDCWLDFPAYPWLIAYFIMYVLGNHFKHEFLIYYASFGAGIYFIVCNLYINLTEMEAFVKTHSSLERLPVKRLGKINSWMMCLQSGLIAFAMFVTPFLGIDQLIRQAGSALRALISFLIGFLSSGGHEETVQQAAEEMQDMMLPEAYEPSALLEFIYKILDIISWMIAIGLVFLFLRLIAKKIYGMYQQFNLHIEENGDKVERLIAAPSAESKKTLNRRRRENLFWDRSPSGRIRKMYKKRVMQELKHPPESYLTPWEIENEIRMEDEKKEIFHACYEKARYGKEECTKEDVQVMMKI